MRITSHGKNKLKVDEIVKKNFNSKNCLKQINNKKKQRPNLIDKKLKKDEIDKKNFQFYIPLQIKKKL